MDRRLALREILEKVFDIIPAFKSKDELLEEEFNKFVSDNKPGDSDSVPAIKTLFQGLYLPDGLISETSSTVGHLTEASHPLPVFSTGTTFDALPEKLP